MYFPHFIDREDMQLFLKELLLTGYTVEKRRSGDGDREQVDILDLRRMGHPVGQYCRAIYAVHNESNYWGLMWRGGAPELD